MLLANLCGARTILEIGTLGGYSTVWLARALPPGGRLVTLEANPRHAEVARRNLELAKMTDRVEVCLGRALDILPTLEHDAPFDFFFVDADKANNREYLAWVLRLARVGSVVVVDNVVRGGSVLEAKSTDPSVGGVRRTFEFLAAEARFDATAIQTVGRKGHDGFTIARVVA
jgi:predicted O-methyltransferase YrrM